MQKITKIAFVSLLSIFLLSSSIVITLAKMGVPDDIKQRIEEKTQARQERVEDKKAEREEKLETIRERQVEKKASISAKINQNRVRNINTRYLGLSKKVAAFVVRLETLIQRIESRVDKVDELNKKSDVIEITSQLNSAKVILSETDGLLATANTLMEEIVQSETPKEDFSEVKEIFVQIKNNLKNVHRILVHVIGDVAGLRVGQFDASTPATPSATLTPEISPTLITPTLTPTSEPEPTSV